MVISRDLLKPESHCDKIEDDSFRRELHCIRVVLEGDPIKTCFILTGGDQSNFVGRPVEWRQQQVINKESCIGEECGEVEQICSRENVNSSTISGWSCVHLYHLRKRL